MAHVRPRYHAVGVDPFASSQGPNRPARECPRAILAKLITPCPPAAPLAAAAAHCRARGAVATRVVVPTFVVGHSAFGTCVRIATTDRLHVRTPQRPSLQRRARFGWGLSWTAVAAKDRNRGSWRRATSVGPPNLHVQNRGGRFALIPNDPWNGITHEGEVQAMHMVGGCTHAEASTTRYSSSPAPPVRAMPVANAVQYGDASTSSAPHRPSENPKVRPIAQRN
jgi:hypothetical protein